MKEPGDSLMVGCEVCGVAVPGFTYRYCCRGKLDLCDCGGDPINTCLCPECLEGADTSEETKD